MDRDTETPRTVQDHQTIHYCTELSFYRKDDQSQILSMNFVIRNWLSWLEVGKNIYDAYYIILSVLEARVLILDNPCWETGEYCGNTEAQILDI